MSIWCWGTRAHARAVALGAAISGLLLAGCFGTANDGRASAAAGIRADGARDVLLLTNRAASEVLVVDPATLETLGEIRLPMAPERTDASADGRHLLVHVRYEHALGAASSCCELRAFDLKRRHLSLQIEAPSLDHVVTGAGGDVLTQRGNIGIEVIDGDSFEHAATIAASSAYALYPGPARWAAAEDDVTGRLSFIDLFTRRLIATSTCRPSRRMRCR